MRKFFGVVSLVAALVAGVGLSAEPAGAAEEYDYAKPKDFWSLAASVADYAVYKPTKEGLQRSGLQGAGVPPLGSTMSTICAGQWTISQFLQGDRDEPKVRMYVTQAPSRQCMPDPRYGEAPEAKWTFKAGGKQFTAFYQGCLTTPAGQPEPALSDCPANQVYYNVDGRLPAAGGAEGPWIHLETDGMTRPQIRSLVRSMVPVR